MLATIAKLDSLAESMERHPRRCLGALAILLALQINPWFYYSPDGCVYLSLARSIASGEEMTVLGQPRIGIPIGYPLLISPAFWISARPFLILSTVNWTFAVALMVGLYRWLRRQLPERAVLITCLIMANAGLWYHCRRPLKEVAFLAIMVWLANGLHGLLQGGGWRIVLRRAALALTLLLFLLTVRYSGIVLVAGFGVALLLTVYRNAAHRRLIVGSSLVIGLCALVAMGVLIRFGGDLYLKALIPPASGLFPQLAEGLRLRISEIGRLTLPGMFKSYSGRYEWFHLNMAFYAAVLPFIAWGWWQLGWRRRDVLALTLPFYFGLYVAWPFDQGARFMLPMLPILIACFWLGARSLFRQPAGWTMILLLLHLSGALGYWIAIDAPRTLARNRDWEQMVQVVQSIRPDQDRLAVRNFDPSLHAMLELSLDRPIPGPLTGPAAPGSIQWILQPKETAGCDGFIVHREFGGYHLLTRTEQTAAPAGEFHSAPLPTISAAHPHSPAEARLQ